MNRILLIVPVVSIGIILFSLFMLHSLKNQKILLVNETDTYNVKLANTDVLDKYLFDWGFWKDGVVLRNGQDRKKMPYIPIKRVIFHITSQVQARNAGEMRGKDGTKIIFQSDGESLRSDGTLDIFLQFDPSVFHTNPRDSAKTLSMLAYRACYQLTHQTKEMDSKLLERFEKELNVTPFLEMYEH